MNKYNLIRLGVLAQKLFEIKEGFEIIEFPSDSLPRVKVAIPSSYTTFAFEQSQPIDFAYIDLQKVGNLSKGEFIWAGYSSRANVLAIMEKIAND